MDAVTKRQSNDLRIWEKLRLIVGEGTEAGVYEARIEDILNGGLVITYPEFVSGHTLLRDGLTVAVQVTRNDAVYQFQSRTRLQRTGRVQRVHLSPPNGWRRLQRRRFARVEISTEVEYTALDSEIFRGGWRNSLKWRPSHAANISGGGVLIQADNELHQGDRLLLSVDILAEADLPSIVIAVGRRMFECRERRFAGLEFIPAEALNDYFTADELEALPQEYCRFDFKVQDRLVTYLFHRQIELRRKGVL